VSLTRLTGECAVHAGDIQSAPHGAAEFIDVDLETLVKTRSIRYLAPQINRYCGDYFELMTCHTGWMLRHKIEAVYATFDIKTVQNKFDLTGSSHYAVPFLVDLWERQVIYVDLYVRGVNQGNTAEGALDNISLLTGEVARMLKTRPTMSDLVQLHILARGARRVDLPEQADLIFGVEQGDFSMNRLEQTLSQLL